MENLSVFFDCRKDYLAFYDVDDEIFLRKKEVVMSEANKFYSSEEIDLLSELNPDSYVVRIFFNPKIYGAIYCDDIESIALNFTLADSLFACVAHHEFSHLKDIGDLILEKDFSRNDFRYFRSEIRACRNTLRNISTITWNNKELKMKSASLCLNLIDYYQKKIQVI